MKNAKEMFEELGYEKQKTINGMIGYIKRYEDRKMAMVIIFNSVGKTVIKYLNTEACVIFMNELQAINKQVEELGWNEL